MTCVKPHFPKDPDMAEPKRVLIIVAPYYEHISTMLIEGATAALEAAECEIHIREVPGALEIPIAIRIALEANAKMNRKPLLVQTLSKKTKARMLPAPA